MRERMETDKVTAGEVFGKVIASLFDLILSLFYPYIEDEEISKSPSKPA
jgi:hypothetical protein